MYKKEKRRYSILPAALLLAVLTIGAMFMLTGCQNKAEGWKKEYLSVVEEFEKNSPKGAEGYSFIYFDGDEIPELVCCCEDQAWMGFNIYSIMDGKAVLLTRYDMEGICEMSEDFPLTSNGRQAQGDAYIEKKGILLRSGGMMGSYWTDGYQLNDGRLECIFRHFYANTQDWAEPTQPINYTLVYKKADGTLVDISKEEDVYFEDCVELKDIEKEYGFSFADCKPFAVDSYLTYEDVKACLQGKRDIVVDGVDYTNAVGVIDNEATGEAPDGGVVDDHIDNQDDEENVSFAELADFQWSYMDSSWNRKMLDDNEREYDALVKYVHELDIPFIYDAERNMQMANDVWYFSFEDYSAVTEDTISYDLFYSEFADGLYIYAYKKSGDKHKASTGESIMRDSKEVYEGFLAGNEKVYADVYDQIEGMEPGVGYSIKEFLDSKKTEQDLDNDGTVDWELTEYHDVKYGFIDCGADGVPELVLKYTYEGTLSDYEGPYEYENVIKYIGDRLQVCAETCSHYRTYETINSYGILTSAGSYYAGRTYYCGYSGVDKEGILRDIMNIEETAAEAIPGVYGGYLSGPDFSDVFTDRPEAFNHFTVSSANFHYGKAKDAKIYTYEITENEDGGEALLSVGDVEIIEKVFEDAAVLLCTEEKYDAIIEGVVAEFGLTSAQFYADEPEFFVWQE